MYSVSAFDTFSHSQSSPNLDACRFNTPIDKVYITSMDRLHFYETKTGLVFFLFFYFFVNFARPLFL